VLERTVKPSWNLTHDRFSVYISEVAFPTPSTNWLSPVNLGVLAEGVVPPGISARAEAVDPDQMFVKKSGGQIDYHFCEHLAY
jgi:hypothetical protein